MNNNDLDEELENSTTSSNAYTSVIKESFFEKIKNIISRPRLGSGNNVKTTNMSFNTWNIMASFRRAFESVSNKISDMRQSKEPEMRNGFNTTIIGKEQNTQFNTKTLEKQVNQSENIIFPPQKNGIINAKTAPDLNSEVAEYVRKTHEPSLILDLDSDDAKKDIKQYINEIKEAAASGLTLEDINVSDDKKEKDEKLQTSHNQKPVTPIEVGTIKTQNLAPKLQPHKDASIKEDKGDSRE